ncbi:hypothetical protein LBMAG42_10690 [Deltaproteobacteria bacterium]|nr:hypothetical protein LBMAG42_10690 [Deltaproteobacteria bacterium]
MPTPAEVLEAQAYRVRARWKVRANRLIAAERLDSRTPNDPTTCAWRAVLSGAHPLASWLDGDAPWSALPLAFPDGLNPRQMITSHPFIAGAPWLMLQTSPES